jgi:hypothetical protein
VQRLEVIDGFKVIFERLAANGDAFLNNKRRLGSAQGVALDRVRRVGQFEVLRMLEIGQPAGRARAAIEFGLLGDDRVNVS